MLKLLVMGEVALARLEKMLADRRGVTSMEYGIIAATTVVIVGTAIGGISGNLSTIWNKVSTALQTAAG